MDLRDQRFLLDHAGTATVSVIRPIYGTVLASESLRRHSWQVQASRESFVDAIPGDIHFELSVPPFSSAFRSPNDVVHSAAFSASRNTRAPPNSLRSVHLI